MKKTEKELEQIGRELCTEEFEEDMRKKLDTWCAAIPKVKRRKVKYRSVFVLTACFLLLFAVTFTIQAGRIWDFITVGAGVTVKPPQTNKVYVGDYRITYIPNDYYLAEIKPNEAILRSIDNQGTFSVKILSLTAVLQFANQEEYSEITVGSYAGFLRTTEIDGKPYSDLFFTDGEATICIAGTLTGDEIQTVAKSIQRK